MGVLDVPTKQPARLLLSTYTSSEILSLSVKEITNPETFDSLGHSTNGGLYDPHLGPTDRNDVCATCMLNQQHCPGHMGHFNLSLPVFNPFYFRNLLQILKASCFSCHRLRAPSLQSHLAVTQLALFDHGLVEAESRMREVLQAVVDESAGAFNCEELVREALDAAAAKMLQESKCKIEKERTPSKNLIELRRLLVKDFLKNLMSSTKKCPHCHMPGRALRQEYNTKIMFTKGISNRAANKALQMARELKDKRITEEVPEGVEFGEGQHDKINDEKQTKESKISELMGQSYLTPVDARKHLREVWKNSGQLLGKLFPSLEAGASPDNLCPLDFFFLDVIAVPPSKFRPLNVLGDRKFENSQSLNLQSIMNENLILHHLLTMMQSKDKSVQSSITAISQVQGDTVMEKLQNTWQRMQTCVNVMFDSDLNKAAFIKDKTIGVKQLLEKKQGLFRKHMMGKRVNYACRSVISPDPYIDTDEIGVPEVFAKKLTYPTAVTPWNVHELRQMVKNGPDVHPGAAFVINENGSKTLLGSMTRSEREAIAKQLLTPDNVMNKMMGVKQVYRHLKNGDVMLLNRQPTLHRPSIMAHKARVLRGEKTIRLHYANCKAYNADFDGDEMNAHFPQSECGRAEAYNLALSTQQYLVPKDGTPLSGLIQDHMVSGVMMMIRGRFFNRADYHNLVFSCLSDHRKRVTLLQPSIVKPAQLWSGKQVISTVICNIIPHGKVPLMLTGKAKISSKNWQQVPARRWIAGGTPLQGDNMTESQVVVRHGELLVGVLDKGHYGATPYGLVHCCYELYGGAISGKLLTSLARLFTAFLQLRGFTLGVEDIIVTPDGDSKRAVIMAAARNAGSEVAAKALGVSNYTDENEISQRYRASHYSQDDGDLKELDLCMKAKTDETNNEINKACFPHGMLKTFPNNNLQLMVQSGAKGSMVNCMQISCLLGQIELEGRRPPLMISGAQLPSFAPYDTTPRAGGFIDGRFLTGIRPQEFFFHCMAGREGLIDTAVKTSRSGYLQRCIIKHLEGIIVNYDMTVRDSDGSVIQFLYGEDGLDIGKTQFLNKGQFRFLIDNYDAVIDKRPIEDIQKVMDTATAPKLQKSISKWKRKRGSSHKQRCSAFLKYGQKHLPELREQFGEVAGAKRGMAFTALVNSWRELDDDKRRKYEKHISGCPDPVSSQLSACRYFGAISERMSDVVDDYLSQNPDNLISKEADHQRGRVSQDEFRTLMYYENMKAMCEPAEAVGLLAAQSIGEPSTQMTLNTFHFAGRGEMNVTLGIPRLREILMVASASIKTPTMEVPFLDHVSARQMKTLQLKLTRAYLSTVVEEVRICEKMSIEDGGWQKFRIYKLFFQFLPYSRYKDKCALRPSNVLHFMQTKFIKNLLSVIQKKMKSSTKAAAQQLHVASFKPAVSRRASNEDDDDESPPGGDAGGGGDAEGAPPDVGGNDSEDSGDEANDGDAGAEKERERAGDDGEYRGEEEEMEEMNMTEEEDDEEEEEQDDEAEDSISVDNVSDEEGQTLQSLRKKKKLKSISKTPPKMDAAIVNAVINVAREVSGYAYDTVNEEWCEVTLQYPLEAKIDMTSLLEQEVRRTILHQTPAISRGFISDGMGAFAGRKLLKTEGVNMAALWKYGHLLDLKHLYSNDIHAVAGAYGIEAAAKVITTEVTNVFKAYGITVDHRHLSLVADYMTFTGQT
ncbi:PREDICTED: DNA-directed RNA polymerase I subunit RPA1-like, partial [Priapulus caudatus]|uniref:DNA-directed RNA polymerase subunit n=1 Tax=Priapulus caudatus TaxID=37621 RepID=A0ABM1EDT9_PRICU